MADKPVLYLGDTSLEGAARYLTGLMTAWGFGYDYVASDEVVSDSLIDRPRKLYILSDYPAKLMDESVQRRIVEQVQQGAGVLMIGGWESFCGSAGHWAGTVIGDALPVLIDQADDRVNCDQPALIVRRSSHGITDGLAWEDRPPTIGGYNRVRAKPGSDLLLEVERFCVRCGEGVMEFEALERDPLLVVGAHGGGRTAALATDVAPHWVGGLVDWGSGRVVAGAPGSCQIEVGDEYAGLLRNLLSWTGRLAGDMSLAEGSS